MSLQHATGMTQTDEHQCKTELVSLAAALCNECKVLAAECRVTDHLALIGREAKQPCLYRFAQQPLSCHRASPSSEAKSNKDWLPTGRMARERL